MAFFAVSAVLSSFLSFIAFHFAEGGITAEKVILIDFICLSILFLNLVIFTDIFYFRNDMYIYFLEIFN